jgi:hypothetical protein
VRLAGFAGLRTPVSRRSGPIVVHVHGSERAKNWRTPAEWAALVGELQARFARTCVLVGAPSEADALARIAAPSRAHVCTAPLGACADLLAEATGLVSVDTVSIHLAAAVGCPSIVLRQGPAGGHAFVPGAHALLVDAGREPATIADVAALGAAQFAASPPSPTVALGIASRSRVREGIIDDHGWLGMRPPTWCPVDAMAAEDDRCDERWRAMWRRSFAGQPPSERELEELFAGSGRHEEQRRAALLSSATLAGTRARARRQKWNAA